ncbi:MAG: M23 family metallopeptidase [Bacteriovoracia bacterium]
MSRGWSRAVSVVLVGLALASGCATRGGQNRRGWMDHWSRNSEPSISSRDLREIRAEAATWQWPVARPQVTSIFGPRNGTAHEGIDLRAKMKTKVLAADAGTVVYSDSRIGGYGRMVVIKHDRELFTVYAHHSRNLVKAGQKVKRGQQIALSGKSGNASGPHLHFEIRRGTVAIDPIAVLPDPLPRPARTKRGGAKRDRLLADSQKNQG